MVFMLCNVIGRNKLISAAVLVNCQFTFAASVSNTQQESNADVTSLFLKLMCQPQTLEYLSCRRSVSTPTYDADWVLRLHDTKKRRRRLNFINRLFIIYYIFLIYFIFSSDFFTKKNLSFLIVICMLIFLHFTIFLSYSLFILCI